jgi:Domain of unknown function (DUF4124)
MNRTSLACIAALTSLLLLPAIGHAQAYKWRDDKGSIVYSDKPPPSNIPPGNVLQGPKLKQSAPDVVSAKGGVTTGGAKASAPLTLAEREAESKKRSAEAAKKSAEEAKKAEADSARLEVCKQLRSQLASIDSGQRQRRVNEKGEPTILDDAQVAAEKARVSQQLASNTCP